MVDNKRKTIISLAWLLLCYCAVCFYVSTCATAYIDADMSSELVLAKLLSEEHACYIGKLVLFHGASCA